jgi:hypothetical protein
MSFFLKYLVSTPNTNLIGGLLKNNVRCYSSNQPAQDLKDEPEADWFENISAKKKTTTTAFNILTATPEEKRELVNILWAKKKTRFEKAPHVLTEEMIAKLVESESQTELNGKLT